MTALRRAREGAAAGSGSPPPEAFDYEDDVTAEAVATISARAKPILEKDEYAVIDGYVGNK